MNVLVVEIFSSFVIDVFSGSVPSHHHQSNDVGVSGRNTTVAFDHEARKNMYQFEGKDSVRQARSTSSISCDSYDDGHKQQLTESSHEKSNHDKVTTPCNIRQVSFITIIHHTFAKRFIG